MKCITFNNYKFYYDSKDSTYIINEDSLNFFGGGISVGLNRVNRKKK